MKTYKLGLLFAGLPVSDSERFRVGQEMEKVGGLTLKVEISGDSSGYLIDYSADGETVTKTSIFASDLVWQ